MRVVSSGMGSGGACGVCSSCSTTRTGHWTGTGTALRQPFGSLSLAWWWWLGEEVVSGDGCESSWLAPWPANRDCSEPIIAISDVMRSQCLARQSRPDLRHMSQFGLRRSDSIVKSGVARTASPRAPPPKAASLDRWHGVGKTNSPLWHPTPKCLVLIFARHTTDQGNRVLPRTLRLHQRAFRLSTQHQLCSMAERARAQGYTLLRPPAGSDTLRQHHHQTLSAPLFSGCHKLELVRTSSTTTRSDLSVLCFRIANRSQLQNSVLLAPIPPHSTIIHASNFEHLCPLSNSNSSGAISFDQPLWPPPNLFSCA